jgi:hypothetical protein
MWFSKGKFVVARSDVCNDAAILRRHSGNVRKRTHE